MQHRIQFFLFKSDKVPFFCEAGCIASFIRVMHLKMQLGFHFPVCKEKLIFVWGLSSHSIIFHSYGDVTIIGEGLQIVTYARHL